MPLTAPFDRLRLPVIGSPLFIISGPELVIAQCKAGVIGSFPALNARPSGVLDEWLHQITEELADWDRKNPDRLSAPFAMNQIVHKTNDRLEHDVEMAVKYKVPVVLTSKGAPGDAIKRIHGWGAVALHDIANRRHAEKALEAGVADDDAAFRRRRSLGHALANDRLELLELSADHILGRDPRARLLGAELGKAQERGNRAQDDQPAAAVQVRAPSPADDAAREAVAMAEGSKVRIIDASSAHRVAHGLRLAAEGIWKGLQHRGGDTHEQTVSQAGSGVLFVDHQRRALEAGRQTTGASCETAHAEHHMRLHLSQYCEGITERAQ